MLSGATTIRSGLLEFLRVMESELHERKKSQHVWWRAVVALPPDRHDGDVAGVPPAAANSHVASKVSELGVSTPCA
jgi:hypothetical protein